MGIRREIKARMGEGLSQKREERKEGEKWSGGVRE